MYAIITINAINEDPVELNIWSDELKRNGWTINDDFPVTCWKLFDEHDDEIARAEFLEAVTKADLVIKEYLLVYSMAAPVRITI